MVRLKHRYLIVQIIFEQANANEKINMVDILNVLKDRFLELYGDVGFGTYAKSLALKYYNNEHNLFILRCTRDGEINVRLGLSCLQNIKQINCICRVLDIAGSTRTCKDKMKDIIIALNTYTSDYISTPLITPDHCSSTNIDINNRLSDKTRHYIDEIDKLSL